MFTGIVEEVGTVRALGRQAVPRLEVGCQLVLGGTGVGDSINVDGCCLTVVEQDGTGFAAEVMGETLARTALGRLRPGDGVNLERAVRADARLGGHLVQGHVDAVGQVVAVERQEGWRVLRVALPPALARYVAEKGSITVDGVSLTVMAAAAEHFDVGLVPHTLEATTLGRCRRGDRVNLEADVVAKYVERLLAAGAAAAYTEHRSMP